ncbi:MAG TPA: L-threonylcarbamoyladenylate synthase [Saprospiraceae bacterium]|nr:L-threonylcarbamoyladenylate synthase [Saprospiraceae bacterium]
MFLLRDDISDIVRILQNDGIICYPTDTIWGVGCDATNEVAIARITNLKGRAPEKGYIVLVNSIEMLKQYVPKIHPRLETLLAYHQRPLTVIYDHTVGLPGSIKAPDGSVGIRLVQDEFCQALIEELGKPLLSTSANKSGQSYPPTFGAISSNILMNVDYVVKHRQDDKEPQQPSSVAKLDRHKELEFLRD